MAQFACTGLKKRQILAAMFLSIFIGLLGVGVIIPVTAPVILSLPIAVGAAATLLVWSVSMTLCVRNKVYSGVTASP